MRLSFTTIIIPAQSIRNVHSDRGCCPIVFYVPASTRQASKKDSGTDFISALGTRV